MIEKMKMVHVVSSVSRKQEMLEHLRDLGILHLAEKKNADREITERFTSLSKTAMALADYAKEKGKKEKTPSAEILSDEAFEKVYADVLACMDRKAALIQERGNAVSEIERIQGWGEFSPAEVKQLNKEGYDLHFYRMDKKTYEAAAGDENVRLIRLAPVDKMEAVAALFNKKVGEVFYVRVTIYARHGQSSAYTIVKGCFNSRGFECIEPVCEFAGSYVFSELLEGKAVIIDD